MPSPPDRSSSKPIQSPLRTPEEVARRIRVSRDVVVEYYETGELTGMDMSPHPGEGNRLLRFDDDAVDRLIEKRRSLGVVLPRRRRARKQKNRSN